MTNMDTLSKDAEGSNHFQGTRTALLLVVCCWVHIDARWSLGSSAHVTFGGFVQYSSWRVAFPLKVGWIEMTEGLATYWVL